MQRLSNQIGPSSSFAGTGIVGAGRELIAAASEYARRFWKLVALVGGGVAIIAVSILPYEMEWLVQVQGANSDVTTSVARALSRWGDFFPGTLILASALWVFGRLANREMLMRVGLACLLAAALGGLFTDVFRFGLGRARPNSGFEDGLYGPTWSAKFHGFPSGHTTSAMATSVCLAVALPEVAVPAIALGVGVGWSRLYLNWHRPTDVLVGATIGSVFGFAFGAAARKARTRSAL